MMQLPQDPRPNWDLLKFDLDVAVYFNIPRIIAVPHLL